MRRGQITVKLVNVVALASRMTCRYFSRSMFSADAHDSLILDAQIPGLILVVVVVTEAIAP